MITEFGKSSRGLDKRCISVIMEKEAKLQSAEERTESEKVESVCEDSSL